jgi:hypothetical protein
VINVVKEHMNSWWLWLVSAEDTFASQKLNTEQDVLTFSGRMYWFLWTTRLFSVKDLYSRFRMWNKNQYCIASCDVEVLYGAVL